MAKDYVIRLQVDDAGAVKAIDNVSDSLDNADKSTASLKAQLREFQSQLTGLEVGSKEFEDLSRKAGQLKDRINDASEAVRANAGNAFESLTNNVGLLGDRFASLDFEGVGSSFKSIASTITNFKVSDLTDGFKVLTSAIGTLGKALLTNPLFLIITGVGLFIANFEKIAALFDGVTDAETKQLELRKQSAAVAKEQLDSISEQENILKLQGKTEAEILKLKQQAIDVAIMEQKALIANQKVVLEGQTAAAERNRDILKGILDFLTAPLRLILQTVDAVGSAVGKDFGLESKLDAFNQSAASTLFDPEQVKADGEAAIKEQEKALVALENQRAGFILQQQNAAKAASQKANEDARKALEERLRIEGEYAAGIKRLVEQNNKDIETYLKDRNKIELTAITTSNDEKFKALQAQQDLEIQLMEDGLAKEIALADQKAIKLREQAQGNAELQKQIAEQNAKEVSEIEAKYENERIERQKAQNAQRISLSQDVLGSLVNIVNSFEAKNRQQAKRQFNINKGLQIAQALIQTYQNTTAAFGSQFIPGDPSSLPRAIGAAALAATQGFLQISKIKQTKFDDSGGGAGGTADAGSSSVSVGSPSASGGGANGAPTFNPLNLDFLNNRPSNVIPAYVISGNVTSAQEADEKVKDLARL